MMETNVPMVSDAQAIEIFKDMIRLDTINPTGNEYLMTDYIATLLRAHGIPSTIVESAPGRSNLVACIGPDTGARPIVLISHVDVVTCDGQTWRHPPFAATEEDGFIYGRGTLDTKHLTAMELVAFLRVDRQTLRHPVYFVATADEEKGSVLGMPEVVKRFAPQLTRGLVINEGGGFYIENQGRPYFLCTVGEKGRCDVHVTIKGAPGPASFKSDDKAMDKFTHLLDKLCSYDFPLDDNPVYRRFMNCLGPEIDNAILRNFARYNGHDACILQKYDIGTQVNVLPYHIEFDFALQLLPGKTQEDAQRMLTQLFDGVDATYAITDFIPGFGSSCENTFFETMASLVREHYGEATLLPVYALGRTDGRFLGPLPSDVYGFSPVTRAVPFEQVLTMVHQTNERIDRESIILGARFFTDLITRMGGADHD